MWITIADSHELSSLNASKFQKNVANYLADIVMNGALRFQLEAQFREWNN